MHILKILAHLPAKKAGFIITAISRGLTIVFAHLVIFDIVIAITGILWCIELNIPEKYDRHNNRCTNA